jgi:predicted O-methyltransferase YrrM
VLGGIFAGLIAPNVFNNTYEYPILIAAALLVLPGMFSEGVRSFFKQAAIPLAIAALVIALRFAFDVRLPLAAELPLQVVLVVLAGFMLFQATRPARFWGLVVLAFAVTGSWQAGVTTVETARSFFGVHQVVETADRTHRLLFHGTTIHGAERVRELSGQPVTGRPASLSYYYNGGPISDVVDAARNARGGLDRVAVVGLGTGSIACHKRDGERWTFFEIDPEVIRIARDPNFFRFLSSCGPRDNIVLGDARLTLLTSPQRYDLIVIDAFSSDAIPTHLLTREALAGYRARLAPNGVLAMHVSNRHMELPSVVAAVAAAEGFVTYFRQDNQANNFIKDYKANADVVAMARGEAELGDLPQRRGWRKIGPRPDAGLDRRLFGRAARHPAQESRLLEPSKPEP